VYQKRDKYYWKERKESMGCVCVCGGVMEKGHPKEGQILYYIVLVDQGIIILKLDPPFVFSPHIMFMELI
jgi:hypothetical protein